MTAEQLALKNVGKQVICVGVMCGDQFYFDEFPCIKPIASACWHS